MTKKKLAVPKLSKKDDKNIYMIVAILIILILIIIIAIFNTSDSFVGSGDLSTNKNVPLPVQTHGTRML